MHNCWALAAESDSLAEFVAAVAAESAHNFEAAAMVDSYLFAQARAMDNCPAEQVLDNLYLAAADNSLQLVEAAERHNYLDIDCYCWPYIAVSVAVDFVDSQIRGMNRCASSGLALRECEIWAHSMSYRIWRI